MRWDPPCPQLCLYVTVLLVCYCFPHVYWMFIFAQCTYSSQDIWSIICFRTPPSARNSSRNATSSTISHLKAELHEQTLPRFHLVGGQSIPFHTPMIQLGVSAMRWFNCSSQSWIHCSHYCGIRLNSAQTNKIWTYDFFVWHVLVRVNYPLQEHCFLLVTQRTSKMAQYPLIPDVRSTLYQLSSHRYPAHWCSYGSNSWNNGVKAIYEGWKNLKIWCSDHSDMTQAPVNQELRSSTMQVCQ